MGDAGHSANVSIGFTLRKADCPHRPTKPPRGCRECRVPQSHSVILNKPTFRQRPKTSHSGKPTVWRHLKRIKNGEQKCAPYVRQFVVCGLILWMVITGGPLSNPTGDFRSSWKEIYAVPAQVKDLPILRRKISYLVQISQNGRGDRIRTYDPLVPNQMRYQAALLPDRGISHHGGGPGRNRTRDLAVMSGQL